MTRLVGGLLLFAIPVQLFILSGAVGLSTSRSRVWLNLRVWCWCWLNLRVWCWWAWPNTKRTLWYSAKHRDGNVTVWSVIASVRAQAARQAQQVYEHRTRWLEVAT